MSRSLPTPLSVLAAITCGLTPSLIAAQQQREPAPLLTDRLVRGEPLIDESFDETASTPWGTVPSGWWLEGAGVRTRIDDGHFLMDSTTGTGPGTLWLDRELPDHVDVSFDVHVLDAIDEANNMNLFLGFRDSRGNPLRESWQERSDGAYEKYHSGQLSGTIITYLANGRPAPARLRIRSVPPFNPVLYEVSGYHARKGQTYHFEVIRDRRQLKVVVDGKSLAVVELPDQKGVQPGGYLGFRTWRTKLWWDNLVIRALEDK